MKREKLVVLITTILVATVALVAFAVRKPDRAQAAFTDSQSFARRVESVSVPELGLVEYKGVVDSIQADSYTVSGIPFRFDALTIVSGTPVVGDSVKVKALLLPDTTRYALKIEKLYSPLSQTKFEFDGIVESMGAAEWMVSGETVDVSMAVMDMGIVVGSIVEVEGYLDGGILVAEKIQLKGDVSTPGGTKVEFFGTIDSISGSDYVIAGKTVHTDMTTEIKGMLAVGDLVKVEGMLSTDGTIMAREIKLVTGEAKEPQDDDMDDDHDDEEFKFSGVVESISDTLWVIGGMSFVVDSSTKIEGSPQVGDMVKVEAYQQGDGSYLAHEIEAEDQDMDDQDDDFYDDDEEKDDDHGEDHDEGQDDDHDEDEDDDHDEEKDHDNDDDDDDDDDKDDDKDDDEDGDD